MSALSLIMTRIKQEVFKEVFIKWNSRISLSLLKLLLSKYLHQFPSNRCKLSFHGLLLLCSLLHPVSQHFFFHKSHCYHHFVRANKEASSFFSQSHPDLVFHPPQLNSGIRGFHVATSYHRV